MAKHHTQFNKRAFTYLSIIISSKNDPDMGIA